jgi:hypothetical protein
MFCAEYFNFYWLQYFYWRSSSRKLFKRLLRDNASFCFLKWGREKETTTKKKERGTEDEMDRERKGFIFFL